MGIKEDFTRSLRLGTGKAAILQRDNPDLDFSEELIEVALDAPDIVINEYEGPRGEHVGRVIHESPYCDVIFQKLLERFHSEPKYSDILSQLFDLFGILASKGNESARKVLYERYSVERWRVIEYTLVQMDGMDALLRIAKDRGKQLIEDPDATEDYFLVQYVEALLPDTPVFKLLRDAATKDEAIQAYVKMVDTNRWEPDDERPKRIYDFATLRNRILEKRFYHAFPDELEEITDDELQKLADELLVEQDSECIYHYLCLFVSVPFPYGYEPLINFTKQSDESARAKSYRACLALLHFRSERIRELVLNETPIEKDPIPYLIILENEFRRDDIAPIYQIVQHEDDFDKIHDLTFSILSIFEKHFIPECIPILEYLYDNLSCGLHRFEIVYLLYQNQCLSDRIISELEYDALRMNRQFHDDVISNKVDPSNYDYEKGGCH